MRTLASLSLSALIAVCGLADSALAQSTWYVDAAATPPGSGTLVDPYTSLQFAIAQPSTVGGDRIEVAPGNYAEPFDFLGKAIHVVGTGGAVATVLDGQGFAGDRSVVRFENGEGRDSVLEGFTITGGAGTYDAGSSESTGGGLRMMGTSPTIRDCVIIDNDSGTGCGIYGAGASPHILDSTVVNNDWSSPIGFGSGIAIEGGAPVLDRVMFDGNWTLNQGGGVYFEDTRAVLRDCTISNNAASYGSGAGIAIARGVVLLERCTISGNVAQDGGNGGGLHVGAGAKVTAIDCIVDDNLADVDHSGGGISVIPGGRLNFIGGAITNNFAAQGGGVFNSGGLLRIEGARIADNTARSFFAGDGNGGGVYGPARLFRCVISGNQAIEGPSSDGSGGGTWGASLLHCTVSGNSATGAGGGVFGAPRISNSIVWGNTPGALGGVNVGTYSDLEGGLAGTGNLMLDPLFTNPSAGDYTLQPASPCIDAGNPSAPLDPDGTRADMGALPFNQGPAPTGPAGSTGSIGLIGRTGSADPSTR